MNFDQRIERYLSCKPSIHPTAFIAPDAVVLGDVTIEEEASVWFHTVVRGDINQIKVGPRSNIQDGSVIHLSDEYPTIIGEYVTCGHKAILHACTIGNEVLVGMGAIILDGAVIGDRSIIGANALVTMNTKIPPGSLVLGSPATIVRQLDQKDQLSIKNWATRYVNLSRKYIERQG